MEVLVAVAVNVGEAVNVAVVVDVLVGDINARTAYVCPLCLSDGLVPYSPLVTWNVTVPSPATPSILSANIDSLCLSQLQTG